jgi:hypothetical protein
MMNDKGNTMEAYKMFSPAMQRMIDNCIDGAIEFIEDMDESAPVELIENRSLREFRDTVGLQVISMLAVELDP